MDPAEHSAGALIQEEHNDSNASENILVPCVRGHETSCPSGECGTVSGMNEMFLNRGGGSGVGRKRQRKSCSGKNNLQILRTWLSEF